MCSAANRSRREQSHALARATRWRLPWARATVSPWSEIHLVPAGERGKSFRSAKGMVLGILPLGGGPGFSMLSAWLDRSRRKNFPAGIDLEDLHRQGFSLIYGAE